MMTYWYTYNRNVILEWGEISSISFTFRNNLFDKLYLYWFYLYFDKLSIFEQDNLYIYEIIQHIPYNGAI